MDRARADFEAAGVPLVLIVQATPLQATHFRRTQGIGLGVLAGRKRESYRAGGLQMATAAELLGPKSVSRGLAKTLRSRGKLHQGKVIGHAAQLGGAMLVQPDGTAAWSHMSEDASDTATPEQILAAARQASTQS